ncbi:MAG: beta-N-acetylhexosaminidase [Elusimicrobia bacterium]|nr:beta-N-acetylhexosaminidase [Elusimicrobiota bacterium]
MPPTIEHLIGQTLVFGIPGPRPTRRDIQLFRDTHAGGLILYRINFRSPAQIKQLILEMEERLERRLLVTMDHEGGRVVMFQSGVTIFPDNLAFGAVGRSEHTRAQGAMEGQELRRLGIDVSFSPTVDVLTKDFSPNIGIRSYGQDPSVVARLAAARIRALQQEGVSACAKHFPGLGPATLDPHLELPIISVGWPELRRNHLVPFRAAIKAGVDMIMSSHPLYPNLEPLPKTPATFSRRLMTDLLRKEMGFRGVVASDDLEMGALRSLAGVGPAAVLAARAGHDMILCCHKETLQRRAFESLKEAYRSGALPLKNLEESVDRIGRLRNENGPRFSAGIPQADPKGTTLARNVARQAVRVTTGRISLPIRRNDKVLILFPRLSDLARKIMIEPALCHERSFIERTFVAPHEHSARPHIHVLPINPGPIDIRRAIAVGKNVDATVFFCFDAHLHPGNRRLLARLQKEKQPLVLVLMRDPYDAEWADSDTTIVTAHGFRQAQLEACLQKLFQ